MPDDLNHRLFPSVPVVILHALGGALLGVISNAVLARYVYLYFGPRARAFVQPDEAYLGGAALGLIGGALLSLSIGIMVRDFRWWQMLLSTLGWTVAVSLGFRATVVEVTYGFVVSGSQLMTSLPIAGALAFLLTALLIGLSVPRTEKFTHLSATIIVSVVAAGLCMQVGLIAFFVGLIIREPINAFAGTTPFGAALIGLVLGMFFGYGVSLWLATLTVIEGKRKVKDLFADEKMKRD